MRFVIVLCISLMRVLPTSEPVKWRELTIWAHHSNRHKTWKCNNTWWRRVTYVKYAPSVEGDPERGGIPRREAARDPDTRGVSQHTRCGFHIRHSPPSSIYITLPFRKSHSNARPGAQSLGNSFIIIICCQSMCQSLYCLNNKFWSVWLI